MTSPYTTMSQVEHSEKNVENIPKKEEIHKSEPEFNFDNMNMDELKPRKSLVEKGEIFHNIQYYKQYLLILGIFIFF